MSHLRIAENIFQSVNHLNLEYLLIGSIAPDCQVPDDIQQKSKQNPINSHYKLSKTNKKKISDLIFYREYIESLDLIYPNQLRFSFLIGYFFHLVADNLWETMVGSPTYQKFKSDFDSNPDFIWDVKRDWYGIDFEYAQEKENLIFWKEFESCKYKDDFLDFMPKATVIENIKRISNFYNNKTNVLENWIKERPNKYLSKLEMNQYIVDTTQILIKVYRLLRTEGFECCSYDSILDHPRFTN